MTDPIFLRSSLALIGDELPGLVQLGNWAELPESFRQAAELIARGGDPIPLKEAAEEASTFLAHHPEARDAVLHCAAELSSLREQLRPIIRAFTGTEFTADLYANGILSSVVDLSSTGVPQPTRGVTIKRPGLGGATSVKLRNVWVNPVKMVEFLVHSALTTVHSVAHPDPILIGLGVVVLANCARESVTVHIPEQDATVFWGLIQSHKLPGNSASSPEPDVVTCTNGERVKGDLGPLASESVARSLDYLAGINCIGKIPREPTHWRVIETFKVSN